MSALWGIHTIVHNLVHRLVHTATRLRPALADPANGPAYPGAPPPRTALPQTRVPHGGGLRSALLSPDPAVAHVMIGPSLLAKLPLVESFHALRQRRHISGWLKHRSEGRYL